MWTLEELGLSFEREDFGGEFGHNRDPQFLALNPNGLVPVLIDGDVSVWESNTIVRESRSNLQRWYDEISARPAFVNNVPV